MKYTFSLIPLLFLILFATTRLQAQDSFTSDTDRKWYYPDHLVFQFAGNIGMFSVGPGYSFLKDKMDAEALYGITPGFESGTSIHILTAKFSYRPYAIPLSDDYLLEPLKFGTGISYSIGRQFHTTWPTRYPDGYYWWTTSFRFTPFIGSTISRRVGNENTTVKRLQLYYEVGTNDLALVSFINNKNLAFTKILNLAIGTRIVF